MFNKKDYAMTIKLDNGSPDALVMLNADGIITQKTVSIEDLTAQLSATQKLSTGILPRGTRYYSGGAKTFLICTETAPRIRLFSADWYARRELAERKGEKYKPEIKSIPFPPLLFFSNIRGGAIRETRVYAVKQGLNNNNDQLYRFPFGNTFTDGKICWGNNKLPTINCPMDIITIMSIFLDAPFNGDLVDSNTIGKISEGGEIISGYWDLIKHLENKEKFPEESLCVLKYKFIDVIREIQND